MTTIHILGVSGSEATLGLRENVVQALEEMGVKASVEHITDVDKFIQYNINGIPALVLNGTVVLQKHVPTVEDLKILLKIFSKSTPKRFDMKKILVPTDFSQAAQGAFQFALELANIHQSEIRVAHVYRPEFDPQNPYLADVYETEKNISNERLSKFVEPALAAEPPVNVSTSPILGFPVEEILNDATEQQADMIVMGTTGEKNVLEKLFGSVSINVAQRADCPVLLVPQGYKLEKIRHIVFASDFESANENTLERLVDFATIFKAGVHFVHVTEDETSNNYKEIENHIFKILFKGGEPSFSFTMSKVEGNSVSEGLNDYAQRHEIDMFVIVSPKRSFWDRLFHKSVTKAMALNTKLPIMVLRA